MKMDYHACSKQVEKKYTDSADIEMLIANYKASIPFANDQNSPLGKLSDIAILLDHLDIFSVNLLSQTKSKIQSEHLSWLMTIRKQIATMYCLIANLFNSDNAINETIISYYFVNYDLHQAFIIINGYVEILVHKAREQKPEMGEIFQLTGKSRLDELAKKMSKAAPENRIDISFHKSDIKVLLEMKQKCNEMNQSIETLRGIFTDFGSTVRLY